MVSDQTVPELRRRLPYVDLFFPPTDFAALLEAVDARLADGERDPASDGCLGPTIDEPPIDLTELSRPRAPARWLPIMNGCNRRCTYCIVPFRRGVEVSRPIPELVAETRRLVADGAREVTLLGQIVDRYGRDLPGPARPGRPTGVAFMISRGSIGSASLPRTRATSPIG